MRARHRDQAPPAPFVKIVKVLALDAGDAQPAGLNDALASLIAKRDLITKLSPSRWSLGTIRGLSSALAVPVVVWTITRVLERHL